MTTTDQGPRTPLPEGRIFDTVGGWHAAHGHAAGFPGAATP